MAVFLEVVLTLRQLAITSLHTRRTMNHINVSNYIQSESVLNSTCLFWIFKMPVGSLMPPDKEKCDRGKTANVIGDG